MRRYSDSLIPVVTYIFRTYLIPTSVYTHLLSISSQLHTRGLPYVFICNRMVCLKTPWQWSIHYVSIMPNIVHRLPLPYVYFTYKIFREVVLLPFLVNGCHIDTHPTAFESSVLEDVTLCHWVYSYQRLRGSWCLHIQSKAIFWPWTSRRRHYDRSKRRELHTEWRSATSQKNWIFSCSAVRTSNLLSCWFRFNRFKGPVVPTALDWWNTQVLSKPCPSITESITFHLSPFARCSVYNKPKIRFMYSSNQTEQNRK
jgi:hypothetical protein